MTTMPWSISGTLMSVRRAQMMLGACLPGVAVPHLFEVPGFILEQFEPDQRPFVIARAKAMHTVNSAGQSDVATREAWQAAIDRPAHVRRGR